MLRALCLALLCGSAAAQQVSMNGRLGANAALLVIDGEVRTVRVGESIKGVKLLQLADEQATVEVGGERLQLRLGARPVAQQPTPGSAQRIVMRADQGGHFMGQGSINGGTVRFMVDTGATMVSLSVADAERLGVPYLKGRAVQMQTANGVITGYLINLDRVRLGSVEINNVPATVADREMPYVLLGNSFLSRFQMKRENELLVLERRY